jgi:hypothetical protein
MPYVVEPGDPLTPTGIQGATQGAEEFRALKKYLLNKTFISVLEKGYDAVGNGVADDTVPFQDAIDDVAAAGGGIVYVPGRGKIYKVGGLKIYSNVHVMGESPITPYDATHFDGGTRIKGTIGDWVFALVERHAALTNLQIDCTGGTVAYGVVTTDVRTLIDSVSVRAAEYGFTSAGLNSNVFKNVHAVYCTKVGFSVLPRNFGGIGVIAYPKIAALVSAIASTLFSIYDSNFIANRVGMIFRDGNNPEIVGGVVEASEQQALIVFKEYQHACDAFTWRGTWFENNYNSAANPAVVGIEHLLTATGPDVYLNGTSYGAYNPAADDEFAYWFGGAENVYNAGAGNFTLGPPAWWKFDRCKLTHAKKGFRLRSQNFLTVEESHVQSASGAQNFSQTNDSNKLILRNIRKTVVAASSETRFYQLTNGRGTVHEDSDGYTSSAVAVASGVWQTIIDLAGMSYNNKYRYTITTASVANYPAYGSTGWAAYLGSGVIFEHQNEFTGVSAAIQVTGAGLLQYKQNSGGPQTVLWKIIPEGQMGTLD